MNEGVTSVQEAPPFGLLGAQFHTLNMARVMDRVMDWCRWPDRHARIIITVNAAILIMMRSDERLAGAVRGADLVVADGMPIVWASRLMAGGLPERVTGVDLMDGILTRGSTCSLRIFLLGTTQARLEKLQEEIRRRYPGIIIAGARNGYFDRNHDAEVLAEIRESGADVLFVGMPAPIKEVWCEEHRACFEVPVVLGVGGAFDVLAGFVPRAPRVLQRAGMEWAWRLALEPRKLWRRYLTTNTQFLALLAKTLVSQVMQVAMRKSQA